MSRLERGDLVYIARQYRRGNAEKIIGRTGAPTTPRSGSLARGLCGRVRVCAQLYEPY